MSRIFVSHSSKDQEIAKSLGEWLQEQGHTPYFLDFDPDKGITGGRRWEDELQLMADNACQLTSLVFMRACRALGIRQAFTSYNNPKGNADTERFMRTLKEESRVVERLAQSRGVLSGARCLGWNLQRIVLAFELRISAPEPIRTTATQPRHSGNEHWLNGEHYRLFNSSLLRQILR